MTTKGQRERPANADLPLLSNYSSLSPTMVRSLQLWRERYVTGATMLPLVWAI